jgi:hypothetical protein
MANQTRFGALQRLIGSLEVGLASLVEKTAQQTGRSKEEIELALEDLGFLASAPASEPGDYDPYDKLRRAAVHIRRLRSVLSEETKKP